LLKDPAEVEKELTAQNASQALSGTQQIAKGQGNNETSAATGSAISQLMQA
jgi:hypothetical protein